MSSARHSFPLSIHPVQKSEVVCEGWVLKKRRKKMQGMFLVPSPPYRLMAVVQGLHGGTSFSISPDPCPTPSIQNVPYAIKYSSPMLHYPLLLVVKIYT